VIKRNFLSFDPSRTFGFFGDNKKFVELFFLKLSIRPENFFDHVLLISIITFLSRSVHAALPELVRKGADPIEAFKPASPPGRYCVKAPVRPGKRTATGAHRIGIAAKVDGGEHRVLKCPGVHEAAECRVRAEYCIKRGIRYIVLIVPEHRADFSIPAERAGVPERCMARHATAHPAHHHVEPGRAVSGDRIMMSDPGTCDTRVIHAGGLVEDPDRKPPHHAPVTPASMVAPVHEPCGACRQDSGCNQREEE
jgi:hypothetical protein